jgi:hypothetical protein
MRQDVYLFDHSVYLFAHFFVCSFLVEGGRTDRWHSFTIYVYINIFVENLQTSVCTIKMRSK